MTGASIRTALLLASSLLLFACSETLPLMLGKEASAHAYCLSGPHREISIQPNTEAHRALAAWIAQNQGGWEPYLATPPVQGVIVRADGFSLQFVGAAVLARVRQGALTKSTPQGSDALLSSLCAS